MLFLAPFGTSDLEDTTFDYKCNTYLPSQGRNFETAHECAAEGAKSNHCQASLWAHDDLICGPGGAG